MMKEEEIRKLAEDYIDSCTKKSGFVILAESLKGDFIDLFVAGFMKCLEVNKANEWHYPSKGELPKEDTAEKETLYLLWFGPNDSDYMTGLFSHGRFWCFDSGWFETNEVIAWKEIVLPKESE